MTLLRSVAAACLLLAAPALSKPAAKQGARQSAHGKRAPYEVLPEQLKARYLDMRFSAEGEEVRIRLERLQYQNPHFKALERLSLKEKMLGLVNAQLAKDPELAKAALPYQLKKNAPLFHRVFTGEGTPDEIAAVLKIAAHLKGKLGATWKEKGDLSSTLQAFYWDNIGLNCNGFVGSYAKAVGASQTPSTPILAYAHPSRRLHKLDEIQPGDVMVWKSNKHITSIQGRHEDGTWEIVESAGDHYIKGLGNSTWKLVEPKSGDVWRATKLKPGGTGAATEVYIASLK